MTGAVEVDDFLAHFGVKGMKWGVRKSEDVSTDSSSSGEIKVARKNGVVRLSSPIDIPEKNLKDPGSIHSDPAVQKKLNSLADKMDEESRKSWPSNIPATVRYSVEINTSSRQAYLRLFLKDYSKGPITIQEVQAFNPGGKITHGVLDLGESLEHFGVKGMRWGVRRSDSSSPKSGTATVAGTSVTREEVRQAGLAIAKKTARYGAPPLAAAAATLASPIGLPSVVALGLSAKVLMDPDAQAAIRAGADYTKKLFRTKDGIIEEWIAGKENEMKYGKDINDMVKNMDGPKLPADKDGPMFNPDAKIDAGRVTDAGDPVPIPDDKWKLPW